MLDYRPRTSIVKDENKRNPWWPLFSANFLSVFNDNLIKWLVVFVGVGWVAKDSEATVISSAAAMLVIPFLLFGPWAGRLNRIYPKKRVWVYGKAAELPIVLIAMYGFWIESIVVVMTAVLLMGVQSSLFSPAKYGLIRDVGGKDKISFGTGAMEMLTFLGVLFGTFLAGVLADKDFFDFKLLSVAMLAAAVLGYFSALNIKANESPAEEKSKLYLFPPSLLSLWKFVWEFFFVFYLWREWWKSKSIRGVNNAIFGLSVFWYIGSLLQMNIALHTKNFLEIGEKETGTIMSVAAIGIALGALFVGWISGKRVRLSYAFLGNFGLTISLALIYFLKPATAQFTILIFFTSFFAGFYKIPLNAFIQEKVKGRQLSDVLAYLNIAVFTFILISAFMFDFLASMSDNDSNFIFLSLMVVSGAMTFYFYFLMKDVRKDLASLFRKR